ncbi:SAM-dependent methyltransferase [Nonomuraea phyllanthi]|uniref:SAM-dependent methyltransferase n=1 Tax=Nonomuraea phyllanthi TaxID=2219224 RepID=UPI0021D5A4B4|nr:SAM-dependent methyltransferase [Nonomuraea phyllanthi]
MYDYWLGGKDNYEADRLAAQEALRLNRDAALCARENRAFLGRAVRFVAESGVRQFLDVGAGLPAMGNVHEVAQSVQADALTLYVDYDPVVVLHGRALLATDDQTVMIDEDLRRPDRIAARAGGLLDFSRPVCVLLVASLHFVRTTEDPYGIPQRLMRDTAPGSFLVISHVVKTPVTVRAAAAYEGASAPVVLRTPEQVGRMFTVAGVELVDPGLVRVPSWRPEPGTAFVAATSARVDFVGGVGRKP